MCCFLFLEHPSHLPLHRYSLLKFQPKHQSLQPIPVPSALLMMIGLRFLYCIVQLPSILSSIAYITVYNYSFVCIIILYVSLIRLELLESRACGCFCLHLYSQFLAQWPSYSPQGMLIEWMMDRGWGSSIGCYGSMW